MKTLAKMSIYVRKHYRIFLAALMVSLLVAGFLFARSTYAQPDFGKTFGAKAVAAKKKLNELGPRFELCSPICKHSSKFMQSIVFPEVMRYNSLKDDVETESLRTLYVQWGQDYANFSIGLFQMKPSFAVEVETKAKQFISTSILNEFQFNYSTTDEKSIRRERVDRLQDNEWQLIYLTAFILICDAQYQHKVFGSETERLQWYATVYNAGFDRTDDYISKKIGADNFYLKQGMPGKKFKYAALAAWYFKNK